MIDWEVRRRVTCARLVLPFAIALAVAAGLLGALPSAQAISSLPASGRAWELVTFSDPTSAKLLSINPMGSSGDALEYKTIGPPPGAISGSFVGGARAVRGPAGWSDIPVGLPFSAYATEFFPLLAPVLSIAFGEDHQNVLWLTSVPVTPDGPPEEQLGLYRQLGDSPLQFIAHVGQGLTISYEGFIDLSRDASRVVFSTKEHLLPEDVGRTQGESVYRWDGTGLHLVDVSTGGALLSACGSEVSQANGMSASAQRVFFTQPAEAGCGETKRVYLRDLDANTTVEASASQCSRIDCNEPQDVTFAGATPDGGSAFLVTAQQLTNDDHDTGKDLYRYDVDSGQLVLLSGGSTEAEGQVNQGVVYPSDDGARVYFRATGVMIPGETSSEEKLYYADEGGMHLAAIAAFPENPQIQLSQSGERALFVSSSKVTEDDTDENQDTYLYDATGDLVTRVSAGASGSSGGNGPFDANITSPYEFPEIEPGDTHPFYGIDASGNRVFFTTAESLLPADVNSKLDVYEWTDGQLGLITPGAEEVDSKFGGVSRDGKTVIFATSATLSSADLDGGDTDLYAARLGGGFPEQQLPPACGGGPCSRSLRAPLVRQSPGSTKAQAGKHRRKIRLLDIQSPGTGNTIGRKTLLVLKVPIPGLVSASVWIRQGGKKVLLAQGRAGAIRPGKVDVRLRLTAAGREGAGDTRKGRLGVSEDGATGFSRSVDMNLGGGK